MSPLFFIGLGVGGVKGLSLEGAEILKKSDLIYLDMYTSPNVPKPEELKLLLGKEVNPASREFIEDGRNIIRESKEKTVALVSVGDPMIATTHSELRIRAEKEGVKTRVLHAASIILSVCGETGLHIYKFGRLVTVTDSPPVSLQSVFNTVYENLLRGLHSLLLLEWVSSKRLLNPKEVLNRLVEGEENFKYGIFRPELFVVIVVRLGQEDQMMFAGRISDLVSRDFGPPPYTILIPGKLHFTEVEALQILLKLSESEIGDNSLFVKTKAQLMVPGYIAKTTKVLKQVRKTLPQDKTITFSELLENVECYTSDAERFLNMGNEDLAVLSIGYAEGLLDALRFLGLAEVPW